MSNRGFLAGFWTVSFSIFGGYTRQLDRYFSDLQKQLPKAGLKVTLPAYLAGAILTSMAAAVAGGVAGLAASLVLALPPVLVPTAAVGSASLWLAVTVTAFYFAPTVLAGSRRRRLDAELPFAVGQLSVLSTSGMTPENLFHSLALEESNGVMNEEARLIVRDMSILGMDMSTALRNEMKRSPSKTFTEFLDGFLSASATGSNLNAYLTRAASSLMLDSRIRAKAVGETVGVAGEVYTIILVVAPLMLLIMFSLIGTIVGSLGGIGVLALMYFIAYFVVPVGGLISLLVADAAAGGSL